MKLALMQPYFFPYLGYFQLVAAADRFVLFDDAQYMKGGWINRNRILKPGPGVQWMTMPLVAHHLRTPIGDVLAQEGYDWKAFALRQVEHYRKKAPYYAAVRSLLMRCFEYGERRVAKLNAFYLQTVCEYVGLPFEPLFSSESNLDFSGVEVTGDWALTVAEQFGAEEYVNSIGGAELFDPQRFARRNVKLTFLQWELPPYDQRRPAFEPGLSIIDVLMFNDPAAVRAMCGRGKLQPA